MQFPVVDRVPPSDPRAGIGSVCGKLAAIPQRGFRDIQPAPGVLGAATGFSVVAEEGSVPVLIGSLLLLVKHLFTTFVHFLAFILLFFK